MAFVAKLVQSILANSAYYDQEDRKYLEITVYNEGICFQKGV
jgi:hypothetical protein